MKSRQCVLAPRSRTTGRCGIIGPTQKAAENGMQEQVQPRGEDRGGEAGNGRWAQPAERGERVRNSRERAGEMKATVRNQSGVRIPRGACAGRDRRAEAGAAAAQMSGSGAGG